MNLSSIASAAAVTVDQGTSPSAIAVAVKAIDAERQAGAGVLKMLAAATPKPASTADVNGRGGTLDVAG